jgi:Tol biopolymer transport system component
VFASPAVSPDGAALAFATHDDGDHGIWRVDVDGSDARPLTAVRSFSQPSWSPDGTKILYADLGHGGGIYVMNADGSSKRRIARTSTQGASLRDLDGTVDGPQWSPSGDRIAYFRGGELWIVGADGGGERRVGGIDGLRDPLFRWSPDGKSIAFTGQIEGLDTEVAVASVDGDGVKRLTNNDVQEKFASWSPDGKALAFIRYTPGFGSTQPGPGDVYVMNADGTRERNLTNSPWDETLPLWSPRG